MAPAKQKTDQSIDSYLARITDPVARKTLEGIRAQLHKLLPGATEAISYQMPTLKLDGTTVIAFAFFGKSCGLYPFSGSVIPRLSAELADYKTTKSGVTFPPDRPLPAKLLKRIVQERLAEMAAAKKAKPATRSKVAAKAKPAGSRKAEPATSSKGSRITDRVTDSAVKEATGRDWKAWMRVLDDAEGQSMDHRQLVAHLAKEVDSGWWRQSIAVAYEQARGKRVVGQTSATGFEVGVQRTLPLSAREAWALVHGQPGRWLGKGARLKLETGATWSLPKGRTTPAVKGEVRVVKPGERVRMSWHPAAWKKPATLQVTLMPKAKGTGFHVHMENLPDAKAREAMRDHWTSVLGALAKNG